MKASTAYILRNCSHTDRVFPTLISAFAMARGSVSLDSLSAEILQHFPDLSADYRFFTRIPHYQHMVKTHRRVGGTNEYILSPTLAEDNPTFYHSISVLAQELFND